MSRLEKLKEKRKQKIKSTIIGLALTISIGATGALGSYAWLVSGGTADNDLVVTTGNLDVEIRKSELYEDKKLRSRYAKVFCQEFEIYNNGNLNQFINLKIKDNSIKIDGKGYSNGVNYKLYLLNDKNGAEELIIDSSLEQLDSSDKAAKRTIKLDKDKPPKKFRAEISCPDPKDYLIPYVPIEVNFKLIAEAFSSNASQAEEDLNNEIYK